MFIIKSATSIRHQAKNVYFLNFNHNTFTKVNRFNKDIRHNSSSSSSLKLKEEALESIPITTNSNLPTLADYIRFLVLSNKQREAQELLINFSKCNIKVDPFAACILFANATNFKKISPTLSGELMRYSSIYGNNPLLYNISNLDKIESNWRLYSNFKRIGYKVDLPLHLYIVSQICSNPESNWEFLKASINNLKNCEEFRNRKPKLPIRLVNSWIKLLIDAERFDLVSLLLDELKPKLNHRTYQLLIYVQSSYNQTLFPHFDMLSILQKSINLNIKLSPPLAARILSYLHNQNHHTELLNWLEVIRDQKTRIPKVTLNKIISELGASEYYSVILRIWEILAKHPDPFNNHIITTILNAFSKANLEQTDYILTNIIDVLKKQSIPLSTSIFNVLMKHSNSKNQHHLTDLYFQLIQENNLKLSAYSYNLMLQKSYKLNDLPTIEGIYELVQTNWFKPNELTYLWLLDIYTELGNWDRVRDILDLIPLNLINKNLKLHKKVEVARKRLEGDIDEYN